MRGNQQTARRAKPKAHAQRNAAVRPGLQRVVMPEVEAFTDREDSTEVKEMTRDFCDVYAAQLADDDFQ